MSKIDLIKLRVIAKAERDFKEVYRIDKLIDKLRR